MDFWKKIGKALLFPHIAVIILLIPVSVCLLVYSLVYLDTEDPISIVSYVISFYTLLAVCFKAPSVIKKVRSFKEENKYVSRYTSDAQLRVKLSLYGTFLYNAAYAIFQLGLGIYHSSVWFYSLAAYYILLSVMRFMLLNHTRSHSAGEHLRDEFKHYRICGILLLLMTLALSGMILYIILEERTFVHHEITTIAMAAYTFTTLTMSIINLVRYRKYDSPVFSAAKCISLAAALVSMITLENALITAFGEGDMEFSHIMTGATGAGISAFIITMAIFMIIKSSKNLKALPKKAQE